jgi:Fic family protein
MYSPKFVISNKILKNIGAIEAAKEVIENAPLVPAFEKEFQSDALVRTVYHGTHIEGNDLTLSQAKRVLEGEEVTARDRDIQEIINYRRVMELLEELAAKRGGYEPSMLKDIHKETVKGIVEEHRAGDFRKTQVVIKEGGTGEVIFRPPPFPEVPYLIEDFMNWLNSDEAKELHPIIRAGIAHYVLVAIHPFVEGNGRAARAFTSLVLMREDYNIKRFFALEEHFDADPESYYKAFSVVDKDAPDIGDRDLTPWLEYFTEVVAIELTKIKEKVRKLSIDVRLKMRIGHQVALSERQMKLIEFLSEKGPSIMQELRKVLPMVSEDTVLRDLKDLAEKRIIRKEGSTKASKYALASK